MEAIQAHGHGHVADQHHFGIIVLGQMAPSIERQQDLHTRDARVIRYTVSPRILIAIDGAGKVPDLVVVHLTRRGADRTKGSVFIGAEHAQRCASAKRHQRITHPG
ncbi:hypothetical protein D7T59_04605 [Stenotrophomonas maltophilia]|nr:hypothetical protein [Stenotrophomonas maltophilia]MBA0347017.1 hypothetical protein [Stenotrophomonas maltophilia]MBA0518709.1 hypothetical protein [Stenotrophomonas maltophilia]